MIRKKAYGGPCASAGHNGWLVGKNEAACAADAAREVVERWLPNG